mgnify:CR=1 FL=1
MLSISVTHPDAEKFIDAKLEEGKVTGANISVKITDDFMKCVRENKDFIHVFPINHQLTEKQKEIINEEELGKIVNFGDGVFAKRNNAKELWDKIIHNAWKSAEPGILYWDTIIRESLPDCYSDLGFKTTSTNPCLVADTPIAVADGRDVVTIGELAKEGKDVPVYCLDDKGEVQIRTMRNPRVTGYNEPIYKVTLDSGDTIRCTGNHKFMDTNGKYIRVDEMKGGESLKIVSRDHMNFGEVLKYKTNSVSNDYSVIVNGDKQVFEHRMISEHFHGPFKDGYVTHHIDYNPLNNNPDNIVQILREEHNAIHAEDMKGLNNPIYKIKTDPKRFIEKPCQKQLWVN